MFKKFRTDEEAVALCKRYGIELLIGDNPMQIANALERAYKDGAKEHSVASDVEGRCKKCDWWNDKGFETCHDCGNEFPHR